MSITITLSPEQLAFVEAEVAAGHYPDISTAVDYALTRLKDETPTDPAFIADLKALLEERAKGPFESLEAGRAAMLKMFAAKRAQDGI